MDQNSDKRHYPRVSSDLSLKLHLDDSDVITRAENISMSGVYCKVNKPIPLMSRISMIFLLSRAGQGPKTARKIETTGVVVREHPVIVSGKILHYDVAIFFDSLSDRDKEIIADHIKRKLQ